jgi:hypothetical protein
MTSSPLRAIVLTNLTEGYPGITPAFGTGLAEAGAVCLEEQGHDNSVSFFVKGDYDETFTLVRPTATEQMRRCWNDYDVATEYGAYGIACLLILLLTDYTIIRRSRRGTGFDYWVGYIDREDENIFQDKARLEVSGMRHASDTLVRARVRKKKTQTGKSDAAYLPAYVIVIEFSRPTGEVVRR